MAYYECADDAHLDNEDDYDLAVGVNVCEYGWSQHFSIQDECVGDAHHDCVRAHVLNTGVHANVHDFHLNVTIFQ